MKLSGTKRQINENYTNDWLICVEKDIINFDFIEYSEWRILITKCD